MQRLLMDDVRDLEPIRNLAALELFVEALRSRVGGEVVLAKIAQELQVAPKTLTSWLEVLERMYIIFVVRPFSKSIPRSLRKAPKVYFFDTGDVAGDVGAKFENQLACQLLKRIHFLEDSTGFNYKLHYVRDKEKREVDFLITKENKVELLVEAKYADVAISKNLFYFSELLKPKNAIQVLGVLTKPMEVGHIKVCEVMDFTRLHHCYLE